MLKVPVAHKQLKRELEELGDRYPKLKPDELFVLWFVLAFVSDDEKLALSALTGGTGDKGTDAVLIDDPAKLVFVVQGKLRQQIGTKVESREQVGDFANLALYLCGNHTGPKDFPKEADQQVQERLREARIRIQQRGYQLKLYYVTLGRFTASVRDHASGIVRSANGRATIELVDGRQVLRLLADYLDGVAPPVPLLDLEMESGAGVTVAGVLQRYDGKTGIESWVFPMTAPAVADIYERAGRRLFARNIRGFLGSTEINRAMEQTLRSEADYFWYYNNGITIICDEAEQVSRAGRNILRVSNPQVINGQQTTRVLHEYSAHQRRAAVLVRVIRVPRDQFARPSQFDALVTRIVAATNSQNYIRPSDLMANDRRQVEIERQLRKLDYLYVRKRQTKSEARAAAGVRHRFVVKKDELAQAVAACELDPLVVREGKERLFEEARYPQVFPNADPSYFLTRYWLMREVEYAAMGYPERAYAKWLVLHFVWSRVSPLLRSRIAVDWFRRECEADGRAIPSLLRAIDAVFIAALRFFRLQRGRGARALDVSTFFKRKGLHTQFESFWHRRENPSRSRFVRRLSQFTRRMELALAA